MSDNKKQNKPNVPNLRFPEFSGEWHEVALNELAPNISSGNSKQSDGIYQLIGSTGIIGTTCKPDYQGKMILVARVGANAGYINYFDGKCGITDNTLIVRPNIQSIDYCKYIYYYLNHIELNRYVFGSGQPLITGGMLKRIKVSFGSISEIKKISQFLSLLDQKIAIQNKVIEKYESLIKALSFEIIGKKRPNTTLTECVNCSSSTLKESDLSTESVVPTYGASGISGYSDTPQSNEDSILITKDGSGVGTLRYVHGSHSFVGTLNSLTAKEGIYLPFIYYALQNVKLDSYKTGLAIPHIYFKDYGKEAIYCPSYEFQKELAYGLEILELKKENESILLNFQKSIKEYLLKELFI